MRILKRDTARRPSLKGWEADTRGLESTRSVDLIKRILKKLIRNHNIIAIGHRGHRSGLTILVDFNDAHLLIDKPRDWPGTDSHILVEFKDDDKLVNYFSVKILSATSDTLYAALPAEIFRLQRRANYRVAMPREGRVKFKLHNNRTTDIEIEDLSAGGMLLAGERSILATEDIISDIFISLPAAQSGKTAQNMAKSVISVGRGQVVRVARQDRSKRTCFGIRFVISPKEEEALQQYVRQRELELLRRRL